MLIGAGTTAGALGRHAAPNPLTLRAPSLSALRGALDAHLGWLLIGIGAASLLEPLLSSTAMQTQLGLLVTLVHLGRIEPGTHRIETPVGVITALLGGPIFLLLMARRRRW